MDPVTIGLIIAAVTAAGQGTAALVQNAQTKKLMKEQNEKNIRSSQEAAKAYRIPISRQFYQAPPSAYRPGVDPMVNTLGNQPLGTQTSTGYVPYAPPPIPGEESPGYASGGLVPSRIPIRKGYIRRSRLPATPMMKGGGAVHGKGGGMDDGVTIRASRGEYVVPADVVAHMGDGSSEAGAKRLDAMMATIRQMKTGNTQQPPRMR